MSDIKAPKKLIEVALPLDDINAAAAREKSIRHGHPSTLHLWWARRPLAAARAVIFAQMVNDPGGTRGWATGKSKAQAAVEREKLFDIIRDLVKWENTNNEEVLNRAREAIRKSWRETCEMNKGKPGFDPEKLPAFHDPFAGGGAIPLEAQRLGLESHASDLNPVAVMINKAMIEIPPRFANCSPVGPVPQRETASTVSYKGAEGLAEDVRRYGIWMREQAKEKIGKYYPPVEITAEMAKDRPDLNLYVGKKLTVIAWIWARTVKSPNPQFSHVDVPLASTFILSSKKGKESYVQPVIEGDTYRFEVKVGTPPLNAEMGTTAGKRHAFKCLFSNVPVSYEHIRSEGKQGRMGARLMAVVADASNSRIYISPSHAIETVDVLPMPSWESETFLPNNPRDFKTPKYGLNTFGDLFTNRQLVALNTFSDLVQEARIHAINAAKKNGMPDDGHGLVDDGFGATAYGDAIAVYLSFAVSKLSDSQNSLVSWKSSMDQAIHLFTKQAIPMVWDFAEPNVFGGGMGDYGVTLKNICRVITNLTVNIKGSVTQNDAQKQSISQDKVVSTDPPYYDNISYADLSDFFYSWLRKSLRNIFPDIFATITVPKEDELVATPYRHGTKNKAETFFLNGMTLAMHNLVEKAHPAFPVTRACPKRFLSMFFPSPGLKISA